MGLFTSSVETAGLEAPSETAQQQTCPARGLNRLCGSRWDGRLETVQWVFPQGLGDEV